jgi:hypothetical protein
MILHVYHNSFISISFPVLLVYRPTTSVNREERCHCPVTQHGLINEGKHVDSVDVAGVQLFIPNHYKSHGNLCFYIRCFH